MDTNTTLVLRVTLRSTASIAKTMYESDLPWGIRHSLTLVAVTESGECIEPLLFIDDLSAERVTVELGRPLTGMIDLRERFSDLDIAVKKSDIHLVWAYKMPHELGGPQWAGGWILISKQR